jgi:hypothetical protein
MNPLEDRLRRGLESPLAADLDDELLGRVHTGARRRRRRRTLAITAATAVLVAGVAFGSSALIGDEHPLEPLVGTSTPTPTPTPTSVPDNVIDLAVPDADHVFALTNDGCTHICSSLWQLDSAGAWQRPQEWGVSVGRQDSVEYVDFAPDARNGWAWGSGLWSTHDGGHTWSGVTDGPGTASDYGYRVHLTQDRAWSLHRTDRGGMQLWSTPIGSDDWTSTLLPDRSSVVDIDTVGDRVVVLAASEGAGQLTLLSRNEVDDWTSLDLPCPGENQPYPAATEVFVLCPSGTGGATVYRSVDLASWEPFGDSDLTSVTAVFPLSDDRVLLLGSPHDLLVTPAGSRPVDVGLRGDEEVFQETGGVAGDTSYLVTSGHRILVSKDAGLTWSQLD